MGMSPESPAGNRDIGARIAELSRDDTGTRRAARHALVEIGRAAVPKLIERLADPDERTRWEAAKTLVAIADPRSAPALVKALDDEHDGVRWLAAEGLAALQRDALPALLQALAHGSQSTHLRQGAHHVIRALPIWRLVEALRPVMSALEHSASESTVPVAASAALDTVRDVLRPRSPESAVD